jgi:hypothetical protein
VQLATISAEILEISGERLPFKVVFKQDGEVIADRQVASYEGGRRLIEALLPLLQKHEGRD